MLYVPARVSENATSELAVTGLQIVSSEGRFTAQRMARRFIRASKNISVCKNSLTTSKGSYGECGVRLLAYSTNGRTHVFLLL